MSTDPENRPKFKSSDVIRNENGRPIAPQPGRKFETMADQNSNEGEAKKKEDLDPTRFGDWEKGGRCVDF